MSLVDLSIDRLHTDNTALRRENERLRAEVAYLGKLHALRAQKQR